MVQAREHQLNQNENEVKLEQVQLRFPHDTLNLSQSLDFMEVSPIGAVVAREASWNVELAMMRGSCAEGREAGFVLSPCRQNYVQVISFVWRI